jgi:ketosteroid isomerase-like protein
MTAIASELPANGAFKSARLHVDPRIDPRAWVSNNERITNEVDLEGWLALYAQDAVFEAVTDGAYDRCDGLDEIAAAVRLLGPILAKHRLRVQKRFVSATRDVIVNAWSGGFQGRDRQFGTELWTLRDGLVVRHEQYMFSDVLPSGHGQAQLRSLLAGEVRVKLALAKARSLRATAVQR